MSSTEDVFRHADRKRAKEQEELDKLTLAELQALAVEKEVEIPENATRFVVVDRLMKHSEAQARAAQQEQLEIIRNKKELQKQNDLQAAQERRKRDTNQDTGMSQAATKAMQSRIVLARKTKSIDLTNSRNDLQALFQFREIPAHVLTAFRVRRDAVGGLRQLFLTNNLISEVSSDLRFLKSLEVLCLSGNRLTRIGGTICGLKRLRKLFLGRNKIGEVPEQIQNLRRLEELQLDHNELDSFSLALTELRNLHRLSLCHNNLRQLPAEIRRLQELVELNLDYNRIGPSLPNNLGRLSSSLKVSV